MYTSSRVVNLGVPGTSDIATSINNAGKIIGQNIALPDSPATDACSGAALEFDDAGHVEEIQGLGADLPSAMNDKGQIVGDHCTDWPDRTVAFSYPPLSILSGPGSDPNDCGHHYLGASDINQRGDVVGIYQNNDCVRHGFLLKNGAYFDIPPPSDESQSETFATALNDRDLVVGVAGNKAILNVGGTTYDLNTLVTGAGCAQWILGGAADINDANVIVGAGLLNGVPHGYMLVPQ